MIIPARWLASPRWHASIVCWHLLIEIRQHACRKTCQLETREGVRAEKVGALATKRWPQPAHLLNYSSVRSVTMLQNPWC